MRSKQQIGHRGDDRDDEVIFFFNSVGFWSFFVSELNDE